MAKGKRGMALTSPSRDLLTSVGNRRFGTFLADPPWQFQNRTGKVAPEHRRLSRYGTLTLDEIKSLPVGEIMAPVSHVYLWVPNAMLPEGLAILIALGNEALPVCASVDGGMDGAPESGSPIGDASDALSDR